MIRLTLRKVGNSLGFILPADAVKALAVRKGDCLYLTEGPEGFVLTPYRPDFERQMKLSGEGLREYRNALRELSKR